MSYRPSPLTALGYPNYSDYQLFKNYLRLPGPYLHYIFKNIRRKTLRHIPSQMGRIIAAYHKEGWQQMHKEADLEEQVKLLRLRELGIPPAYADSTGIPSASGDELKLYQAMLERPDRLAQAGQVIYLHSPQGDQALFALTQVIKAAGKLGVSAWMVDFPGVMDEIRKFDKSDQKGLKKLYKNNLVGLYLVGTEYVSDTGFTEATIDQLLRKRKVNNQTTLICSHLNSDEFTKRYGLQIKKFGGIELSFDDPPVGSAVKELVRKLTE